MKHQQTISLPGVHVDHVHTVIDTNKWTTQAELTKKLGLGKNVVNGRVRRYLKAGLIPDVYIIALGIRLIPNVNNINELGDYKK